MRFKNYSILFSKFCPQSFKLIILIFTTAIMTAPVESRAAQPGQTFRDCPDCPEMVVIPTGNFLMGSSEADTARDLVAVTGKYLEFSKKAAADAFRGEHPQHPVNISTQIALGKYPVTWAEFQTFIRETGYLADDPCRISINHHYSAPPESGWQHPGYVQSDRSPVVCVSWDDAQAYIAWLNKKVSGSEKPEKGRYRLPSEAEWEFAARAGTATARWWGDQIGTNNAVCTGCGSRWDETQPAPVGSFRPNQFGLYDLLGSVFQWTEDCLSETYVGARSDQQPSLDGNCGQHMARGGSWISDAWALRSAHRTHAPSAQRLNGFGFRVEKNMN